MIKEYDLFTIVHMPQVNENALSLISLLLGYRDPCLGRTKYEIVISSGATLIKYDLSRVISLCHM